MTPAQGTVWFGIALLFGVGLGFFYDVFRPLGHLGDFFFVSLTFYCFLYLGFGVCRGDIRLGVMSGMFWGAVAWKATLGRFFAPIPQKIIKKTRKTVKFFLPILKNRVKIKDKQKEGPG